MKAIKDCNWEVMIFEFPDYHWTAMTDDDIGVNEAICIFVSKLFKRKGNAIKNWKKFAELNNITNFKIVE